VTDDEQRQTPGFGFDLEPPADYDPFETRRRVDRSGPTGPLEPTLLAGVEREPLDSTTGPKIPYWDRPKPKKDWYWFLGRLGAALIILGILMFLFVGYQLWGTGIEEAQSQNRLEQKFAEIAATSGADPIDDPASATSEPPVSDPADSTVTEPPSTVPTSPDPIAVVEGDPIAIIEIPAIGVSKYVVAGVETADLKKGPGHYPYTPFPGELGNASIAGHRTTYGEPFRRLDDLEIGDEIRVTDLLGRLFVYRVTDQKIVAPSDSWVVATTDPSRATLTLTTCHPEFSARQRLIVSAELDTTVSSPASEPAAYYANAGAPQPSDSSATITSEPVASDSIPADSIPADSTPAEPSTTAPMTVTTTVPTTIPTTAAPIATTSGDGFSRGWFSDPAAWPQFAIWTLVELLIVWGSWRVARRFRNRLIGAAVGFVPFFVVLYFVFQNVNRLLPPNL
jgi:sortase A